MAELGYLYFDEPYLVTPQYLYDGQLSKAINLVAATPEDPPAVRARTHKGTHVLWKPYRGTTETEEVRAQVWSFPLLAAAEADWYQFKRAESVGDVVWWCPGFRVVDRFASAASGTNYTLSRPAAKAVIAGVTESTHPTIYVIDGSEGAGGSVTGQTFAATATGDIEVHYTPIHRVVCRVEGEALEGPNILTARVVLEEVLLDTYP